MSSNKPAASWSIRRRLASGLALVTFGVLAVLFLALDHWVGEGVDNHLDQLLAKQARGVETALLEHDQSTLEQLMPVYRLPDHADFFTVYDPRDVPRLNSSNSGGTPLPLPPASAGAWPVNFDLRTPDDHAARGLAIPLASGRYRGWTLVMATEREDWDAFQQRIHYALMAGIALATAIVIALSLLLVRSAFAPLMRARERIATLDPQQADATPIAAGLPSELAPFASAFASGVGRLYHAIERERRFSRDIAHELRTPLAEIRTGAEVALAVDSHDAMRNGLHTVITGSERMQRGIDTLLALARHESGQDLPAPDPLDLAQLLGQHVHWLRPVAEAGGRHLSDREQAPAWIHSDVGMLERILDNLIQNAVEYAPPGSSIDCAVETVSHEGARAYRVCIANDAPELTVDDVALMGTRFWRKGDSGGTAQHAGLGLALAGGFAQALGTRLRFDLDGGRLTVRVGPFAAL